MNKDIIKRLDRLTERMPKRPDVFHAFLKLCTTAELEEMAIDIPLPGAPEEQNTKCDEKRLYATIHRIAARHGYDMDSLGIGARHE